MHFIDRSLIPFKYDSDAIMFVEFEVRALGQ